MSHGIHDRTQVIVIVLLLIHRYVSRLVSITLQLTWIISSVRISWTESRLLGRGRFFVLLIGKWFNWFEYSQLNILLTAVLSLWTRDVCWLIIYLLSWLIDQQQGIHPPWIKFLPTALLVTNILFHCFFYLLTLIKLSLQLRRINMRLLNLVDIHWLSTWSICLLLS